MPKLIPESTLAHFVGNQQQTSQAITIGRLNGFTWFCKRAPHELSDPSARRYRLLNEAICGTTMELLNESLEDAFYTPKYQLVVNERNELTALLSQEVDYDCMGDYELNSEQLLSVLAKPGLAEISTIRYSLLQDPDSFNNVGYSRDKLTSLDYGLSNYLELIKQNALTEAESKELSEINHHGHFSITLASVFVGILKANGDEGRAFLAHHVIDSFNDKVANFCDTHKEAVISFLKRVYRTYSAIASLLKAKDYRDKIIERLGIQELSIEDQKTCARLMENLVKRATTLSDTLNTLRRCSPTQFLELAKESKLDERITEVMLQASPHYTYSKNIRFCSLFVNSVAEENARKEAEKTASLGGVISPANGGGKDGYSTTLTPQSASTFMRDSETPTQWLQSTDEMEVLTLSGSFDKIRFSY